MPGIKEPWCYIIPPVHHSHFSVVVTHTHNGHEVALVVFSLLAHYKNLAMQENSLNERLLTQNSTCQSDCYKHTHRPGGSDVTSQVLRSQRTLADSHTHVFSCVVHFPLTSPTREEKEGARFEREGKDRQKEREESVRRNKVKVPRKWKNGRVF